jgi:hypothetical protein
MLPEDADDAKQLVSKLQEEKEILMAYLWHVAMGKGRTVTTDNIGDANKNSTNYVVASEETYHHQRWEDQDHHQSSHWTHRC